MDVSDAVAWPLDSRVCPHTGKAATSLSNPVFPAYIAQTANCKASTPSNDAAIMPPPYREDRVSGIEPASDQRTPFQRDRDRILYAPAFRRLSGVTQVIAPEEGHVFHNRLTHTLKVAQTGRRLAEWLWQQQPALARQYCIDSDVVEAACLAHDLGHPPFGHIAEEELGRLVSHEGHSFDSYEGNAQSFRIVTKLSPRDKSAPGLDLTRATLNAILKYPWLRQIHGKKSRKWGAYYCEKSEFEFARGGFSDPVPSVEAQLMTWADDIAYAVHDTEDFFRAGLIPLDRLGVGTTGESDLFLDDVFNRWTLESRIGPNDREELQKVFERISAYFPVSPYAGRREDRFRLANLVSNLVGSYIKSTKLMDDPSADGNVLAIDHLVHREVAILHELTWHYVIFNPGLAIQQQGQRHIISQLFNVFMDAVDPSRPKWHVLPSFFQSEMQDLDKQYSRHWIPMEDRVRVIADTIASMTDGEALRIYQRLTGILPGSPLDPIVA